MPILLFCIQKLWLKGGHYNSGFCKQSLMANNTVAGYVDYVPHRKIVYLQVERGYVPPTYMTKQF